jgi:hypothetical protein
MRKSCQILNDAFANYSAYFLFYGMMGVGGVWGGGVGGIVAIY